MIVLLLLSFFFSSKIESALGLNVVLNKNETTNDKIASSKYEITYLDVGQGNSAFIRFPDGKVAIVDGGNYMYGDKITRFLKEKDVKVVDYIIATHADADHISGLISVLDNFEVKHILRPFQISGTGTSAETFEIYEYEDLGAVYEYYQTQTNNKSKISRVTSNVYKEFIRKTYCETYLVGGMETKSDVTVFYDGLKISGDNYVLEFFAPLVRDDEMDLSGLTNTNGYATVGYGVTESNGNSAIFLVSCYNDKYLFTGDAPFKNGSANPSKNIKFEELDFVNSLTKTEKELLKNITVYLAGHHGSEHSTSDELLKIINPRFVVFSVGEFNDYGHPSAEVIFRLERSKNLENDYLLCTDKNGDISFINVNSKVLYVKEKEEGRQVGYPSWEMFSAVFGFYFIVLIYSIKEVKKRDERLFKQYK